MWGNLSSALQVEVFWTKKDYKVINTVCKPESYFSQCICVYLDTAEDFEGQCPKSCMWFQWQELCFN